jgi:hypothetical protein
VNIIPRLLLVLFLLLATILPQEALAGSCNSTGCNAAPYVQRAPATASASHAFTAIGGSRVAGINLSQEVRDAINAGVKEAPLPKGFLTAADRPKLIAKQPPLYGWPQDEIARPFETAVALFHRHARVAKFARRGSAVSGGARQASDRRQSGDCG